MYEEMIRGSDQGDSWKYSFERQKLFMQNSSCVYRTYIVNSGDCHRTKKATSEKKERQVDKHEFQC